MKNKIIYTIIGILCVLVVSLGVTLAYWLANVEGTGETITLELADLKVILNDPTIVTETGIEPGWSTSKTFTVENQGNAKTAYNIVIENYSNTLVSENYLQYKITSDNGHQMSEYVPVPKANESVVEIAYGIEIEGKEIHSYTIEFRYIESNTDQSEDMGKIFSGNLSIKTGTGDKFNNFKEGTLAHQILEDNPTRLLRLKFDKVLETENTGTLYTTGRKWTEDVNGDGIGETVYYYAGNALNNWVKFGKDQNGSDLYWRIIRTNEDGGVRLLYVGTAMNTTEGYIGGITYQYNSIDNNTMYVGYMYGSTGSLANNRNNTTSAPIKTTIDNWYNTGLNTKTDGTYTYDKYISKTAIYCNDRATSSYASSGTMYYAAYDRLYTNKQPSYKCGVQNTGTVYSTADSADKFSASTTSGGNGKLTYPVALMTADEVAYAGAVYDVSDANSYIIEEESYWTMSPLIYDGSYIHTKIFRATKYNASLDWHHCSTSIPLFPALSLVPEATVVKGTGINTDPYIIG